MIHEILIVKDPPDNQTAEKKDPYAIADLPPASLPFAKLPSHGLLNKGIALNQQIVLPTAIYGIPY